MENVSLNQPRFNLVRNLHLLVAWSKSGSNIATEGPGSSKSLVQQEIHSLTKLLLNRVWDSTQRKQALNHMAKLLLYGTSCHHVLNTLFKGVMLDLMVRANDLASEGVDYTKNQAWMSVMLSQLAPINSEALQFSLGYFQQHKSPLAQISSACAMSNTVSGEPVTKKRRSEAQFTSQPSLLQWMRACYGLCLSSIRFHVTENWQALSQYLNHTDPEVRWLACKCLATVTEMSELEQEKFMSQHLSLEHIQTYLVKYAPDVPKQSFDELDVPYVEDESHFLQDCDFSSSVVSLAGVLLPVANPMLKANGCLVPVTSTLDHLRSVAMAVAEGRPVLLEGPVGCGKTSLVEHVAQITGRGQMPHFVKVQLGDQTDSKVLVGSYRCTDVPGEFVWQPGVLTQAVTEGRWLLLEDIDYAPMDVISLLVPVLESKQLQVPGHGNILQAAPGFQLFATQRLIGGIGGMHKQQAGHSSVLEKYWKKIHVEPLSSAELKQLIEVKFPSLASVADRILSVYFLLSSGLHSTASADLLVQGQHEAQMGQFVVKTERMISTRDLMKWCARMNAGFQVTSTASQLNAFQDALDFFCACVAKQENRLKLAEAVGARWNVLKAKAEFYINSHKPVIEVKEERIQVGRISLPKRPEMVAKWQKSKKSTFSFTRQSAVLLERIAVSICNQEPVLLIGETGTGKTTTVQYLAQQTGHKLIVVNMNQQSDSTDLLGGFKPVDLRFVVGPVREEFEELFSHTFSKSQNSKFLGHIMTCYCNQRWSDLFKLMSHSQQSAVKRCEKDPNHLSMLVRWQALGFRLQQLRAQLRHAESALAFTFVEGSLVKALKNGDWVLLDEINLAAAETLECLSGLLEGSDSSLYLLERGDREPVKRHPDFRLFACMNPATDVGKKELPPGIRNRFTEFYVEELVSEPDLKIMVGDYLRELSLSSTQIEGIVKFYLQIRNEATKTLTDGTGRQPHYSLRTLCRALAVAAKHNYGSVPRSLYEGFCLGFLTQLDRSSHPRVEELVVRHVLGKRNVKSVMTQEIPKPSEGRWIQIEGYWLPQGDEEPKIDDKYIMTESVRLNLRDLVRVVSGGKHPVLLQGETSVGKTSLIKYLAHATGNRCLRVNNHEHTDLQEYIGSYTADATGKLVFKEGVLIEAMRRGYWIILDELNLAPSDVLEALNRVLDENRELFIPETQETVQAHPRFLLFATQNPAGLYGGRKVLSRAFRNRFIELHFDQIPSTELETILHLRCDMPMSYCKRLVAVLKDLQLRRRGSAAFAGKQGFITLRDLFRWAERYRLAPPPPTKFYDWDQHLADEGYLLLAGRVRKVDEAQVIREVLEKHLKRKVDEQKLFTLSAETSPVTRPVLERVLSSIPTGFEHLVWTFNMRRLAVLVGQAFRFQEPVLLVGETGCGKTTVCQLLAEQASRRLFAVNCHQYSEGSDFLGGLRPARDHAEEAEHRKLFEWVDGPLVLAMKSGHVFLADEISLADDSVLERLNSVLEPERTLLLAEKGAESTEPDVITAQDEFRFIGTMNPGGDYGKKELSPALRNRFTEIWCPITSDATDMVSIIEHNLRRGISLSPHRTRPDSSETGIGSAMMDFIDWFSKTDLGKRTTISIRDILAWASFINRATTKPTTITTTDLENLPLESGHQGLPVPLTYIHGACMVFLDALGTGVHASDSQHGPRSLRQSAIRFLAAQMESLAGQKVDITPLLEGSTKSAVTSNKYVFGIAPFLVAKGPLMATEGEMFTFQAPTTSINLIRVLRALQLNKPMLLEGSPGVGKTSLVAALAKAAGYELVRINLSEQTDVSDLFGADLPVEGGQGGHFAWRDGPLLQALKAGHWIVLDELNLASQSVLEGLNACLDHRGELYIPELGKTFYLQSQQTRLFACQNPLRQGGARKGLPRSFLNRFTQVFVEPLSCEDLEFIASSVFPQIPERILKRMVAFNSRLVREVQEEGRWGQRGGPWELNLRDMFRWCEAIVRSFEHKSQPTYDNPGHFVQLIYADRMRTLQDKQEVLKVYSEVFGDDNLLANSSLQVVLNSQVLCVGGACIARRSDGQSTARMNVNLNVLQHCLAPLESLMRCVAMNWMAILVGTPGSGKSSLVQLLSQLTGHPLQVMTMNSAMDTTELLGGFEQADLNRRLEDIGRRTHNLLNVTLRRRLTNGKTISIDWLSNILDAWNAYIVRSQKIEARNIKEEVEHFVAVCQMLRQLLTVLNGGELTLGGEIEEEAERLRTELDALLDLVTLQRAVNGGGRFEWVDSVLVQCLRQGHWLLIDNVNFCSPSVLDRLNALLEPNGVLVMSERGVAAEDNRIPTIKPHPDFRLFLAMDPRHGEISRAMRNRGVEMYIPGPEDGTPSQGDYNTLDYRTLFNSVGFSDFALQDALLAFHRASLHATTGSMRPTFSDVFSAASTCVQYLSRYGNPALSLYRACQEVYVKACRHSASKTALQTLLNAHAHQWEQSLPTHSTSVLSCTSIPPYALQTRNLFHSTQLAMVTQSACVIEALVRKQMLSLLGPEEEGSSEFKESDYSDLANQVFHAVIRFYLESSYQDVPLRTKWLRALLGNASTSPTTSTRPPSEQVQWNWIAPLGSKLQEGLQRLLSSLTEFPVTLHKQWPWDLRWFPDIYTQEEEALAVSGRGGASTGELRRKSGYDKKAGTEEGASRCPDVESHCNRVALWLYYTAFQLREEQQWANHTMKKGQPLLYDYCHAVHHGTLAAESLPHRVFAHLARLLSSLDECINVTLSTPDFVIPNEELQDYWHSLYQRVLFAQVLREKVTKSNLERVLHWLGQHLRWLCKSRFYALLKQQDGDKTYLKQLELLMEGGHLHSIYANRFRKALHPPKAFCASQRDQYVLEALKTAAAVDLIHLPENGAHPSPQKNLITLHASGLGQAVRQDLANLRNLDGATDVELEQRLESLKRLQATKPPNEGDEREESGLEPLHIQLWPFWQQLVATVGLDRELGPPEKLNLPIDVSRALAQVPGMEFLARLWSHHNLLLRQPWMFVSYNPKGQSNEEELTFNGSKTARAGMDDRFNQTAYMDTPILSLATVHALGFGSWQMGKPNVQPLGMHSEKKAQIHAVAQSLWRAGSVIETTDCTLQDAELALERWAELWFQTCHVFSDHVPEAILENQSQWDLFLTALDPRYKSSASKAYHQARLVEKDIKMYHRGHIRAEILRKNTASLWVDLGVLQTLLLTPMGYIDPAQKYATKKAHASQELKEVLRILQVYRTKALLTTGKVFPYQDETHTHSFITFYDSYEKILRQNEEKYAKQEAYRPTPELYDSLVQDVVYYASSLGSGNTVESLHGKLVHCIGKLHHAAEIQEEDVEMALMNEASSALKEVQSWQHSQFQFVQSVWQKYAWYPDIITPLLVASFEVAHGLNLLHHQLGSALYSLYHGLLRIDVTQVLADFIAIPSLKLARHGLLQATSLQNVTALMVDRVLGPKKPSQANLLQKQLLLASLGEVCSVGIQQGQWTDDLGQKLQEILFRIVHDWEESAKRKAKQEEEKESLYRVKEHKAENEEEENKEAIREMFPSYTQFFADFEGPSLESGTSEAVTAMESDEEEEEETILPWKEEDMVLVVQMHLELMKVLSRHWNLPPWKSATPVIDSRRSFLQKYQTMSAVLEEAWRSIEGRFDGRVLGAHLVACHLSTALTHQEAPDVNWDVYKDPCVQEAVLCKPVLENLRSRVRELLLLWPGHATLVDMVKLIERIECFDVTASLMQFVTGLELLLSKAQLWEDNAHKGVSIAPHLQAISELILKWRKLELHSWKSCLNVVARKSREGAAKWWFHLFSSMRVYLADGNVESDKENDTETAPISHLFQTLQQFMESSTLGQFQARLEILRAFMTNLCQSKAALASEALEVVWNVCQFYSQFEEAVVKKIKYLRDPIEKEVKNFVKIMRWNDINFWAMKETVAKSHQTLHKHTRVFESALKQSVKQVMTEPKVEEEDKDQEGVWDKKTNPKYEPHFGLFMASNQSEVYGQLTIEDLQQTQILNRLPDLYPKARHICRDVVESLPFYTKTSVVNDFVGEIITTVKELQKQPSYPNDKDREKAEGRALHARKRKSLAELFRLLQRMGLSYRKGAVSWKDATQFQKTRVPIIEIEGAVSFLPSIPTDTDLKQAWDSVPLYYNRCVARLALLATSLDTPSKELGPALIERCRGFSAALMMLVQQQWRQTADLHQTLCQIRHKLAYVKNVVQATVDPSFPDQTLVSMQANLAFWLLRAQNSLQQYELLILSCPEEHSPQSPFPVLSTANGAGLLSNAIKGDETWQRAENYVTRTLGELDKLRDRVCEQSLSQYSSKPEILSWSAITSLQEHFRDLSPIMELLRNLRSMFEPKTQSYAVLTQIVEDYETLLAEFSGWETSKHREEELSIEVSRNAVEKVFEELCGAAIFPMQALFKKYSNDDTKPAHNKGDQEEEEEGEEMEVDHLARQIVENLQNDVTSLLQPSKFAQSLQTAWDVAHRVAKQCPDESEFTFKLLAWSYPLMEQYLNLATFYLTQQVFALRTSCKLLSVLLSIFSQLAQKGFCLPSELAEELSGSGTTQFEDIESGGLGEGDGAKDTSDKLESEDQLEGAKQAGQEDEKEQDNPVPEEENGIEMSDDFEGAMQDREKGEDDEDGNGPEDENDDELDKQMGDVDQNENKLDDEIWGDDEEAGGDDEDRREDEDNQGEGTGAGEEPELAAKDDKKKSEAEGDDNENTENQDEAEDERQQPQINEMDEENYNDDQADPYHGKQGPEPEPEAMDLPDDLNLDGGEQKNDAGEEEENPFDIDNQKEDAIPEVQAEEDKADEATDNPEEQKEEETPEDADGSETKKKQPNGEDGEEAMDEEELIKEGEHDKPEATQDEEEEHKPDHQEKATPSIDRPSTEEVQAALPESQRGTQDETRRQPTEEQTASEEESQAAQNVEEADNEQGIGQAEKEDDSGGHEGAQAAKVRREAGQDDEDEERNQSERKPGQSDVKRSLADLDEMNKRKIRPLETKTGEKEEDEDEDGVKQDEEKRPQKKSDVYEHIRQAEKDYDALTMDTATDEQAKERPVPNEEDEKTEEKGDEEQMEMKTEEEDELPQEDVEKREAEKRSKKKKEKNQDGKGAEEDMTLEETENPERMEIEGDTVVTATAARGPETTFHTQDVGNDDDGSAREPTDWRDIDKLREELEQQLSTWTQNAASLEDEAQAQEAWLKYEAVTSSLAMDLCEQLRLVLEPSQAAKLKGDYRTGKRLNMRKVIPYIASQFRKDKIWLRRTKPSKRQYQIALAIDDSSSMADSHSRQLAFESLALISKALTLLEAGELAIISFGEQVRLLHSFQEPFSDNSGARLLHQFSFDEKKTRIAQLVDYTTGLMLNAKGRLGGGAPDIAQLLVIVSDGRGLFNEGMEPVHQAIRRAKEANVFMVFVIVDNPENKDSILDIRVPVFGGPGQLLEIRSYMDQFPFPYYLILRDINSLPSVLSDALRQWFELVSSGVDH